MLEVLFETREARGSRPIPAEIARRHGGEFDLLPSTRLFANFVSSLDGIVELGDATLSSGSAISGRSQADRFLMGLLRACAEHILVGAGTFNAESRHAWTAGTIFPALAAEFAELRRDRGLAPEPTLLVATRSGRVSREHPAFGVQPVELVSDLGRLPEGRILCEGGPHLMGALAGRVDEVFVTLSPVIAGRSGPERLGMVEGRALPPDGLIRHRLLSLRRAESLLFTRYEALDRG